MVKGVLSLSRLDYTQIPAKMSRGGRGGFGGRGRGRGGSSASAMPNTGLTHEDMQLAQMRREPQPLYPVYRILTNQNFSLFIDSCTKGLRGYTNFDRTFCEGA